MHSQVDQRGGTKEKTPLPDTSTVSNLYVSSQKHYNNSGDLNHCSRFFLILGIVRNSTRTVCSRRAILRAQNRMLEKSLFAAQHIFSTHLRLASLQIQNSPFGLKH